MAILDSSTLRTRLAASVAAVSGWTETRWAPELFDSDSNRYTHHSFSVAMPETITHQAPARRRVSPSGLAVRSSVLVRWAHKLQIDDQIVSYGQALDAEDDVRNAILGAAETDLHVVFNRSSRRADPLGWVLGTIIFDCIHRI